MKSASPSPPLDDASRKAMDEWTQVVVGHLTDVFAGRCSLTLDGIRDLGEDSPLIEVLSGILILHEELQTRETQRAQAVQELEQAVSQLRSQNDELLRSRALNEELSTPLMRAGSGVLMLPIIGALDEDRSALIVPKVLDEIKNERAHLVILDITGVSSVDARTAQFLTRLVKAAALLGAKTILAGVKPAVAKALIAIEVDLSKLIAVRDLAAALQFVGLRAQAKLDSVSEPQ